MGVGKSRLLAAARSSAAVAGIRTLSARASELEREFPFGVVRQLFEAAVADPAERERLLSGAAAPAAAVFGADTATAPGVDASFASLHGLFWLAVNLSTDGPLVLAIDDLHWSDTPSLRFVAYLAQRLDGLPILLAATLRTGEGAADATLLAEIARDPAAVSIRPRPLTEAAVAALVRERLGDDASDAFCTACHRATVGNPLLTRQLLTALEADGIEPVAANAELVRRIGPTAVSRSVLLRIARLGDEPRSVARAVAVLGESAELPTIGALAELDEESVATAASKLARSEVLRAEPPPGFVHPLVRDAVYHDLSLGERELQHERAARLLAETGAPAERVASHVLAMPRRGDPWASELLVEASRGAMAKGAGESAAAYLARALAEPPPSEQRPKVLFELGMAERLTSAASAARHLEAAYTSTVDPVERGHVAYALGSVRLFSGAPGGAAEVTREAAAALPHGNDDLEQRLLAVELSAPFFAGGRAELRRLDRFRDVHGPMTIGMRMLLSITALNWAHTGSTADECSDLALRALGNGELIASDAGLTAIPAIFALAMADRDEAVVAWEQATAEAHRNGSLISMALIGLWHGMTAYFRGEFDEAEDLLTTGLGRVERWGLGPSVHTFGRAVLAAVLLARGRREEAWLHIDAVEDTGEDSDALGFWLWSKTDLLLNDRRWDDVIATADEFARRYPDTLELGATITESMRAMALAQLGRREEALEILHEQLAASQHWGAPTRLGPSYRILAGVETERALEYLHESLAVLEPSPNRLQHAKTLFALAQHLRGTGSADEAVDHLRLALEMAEASGADRLLGDIAAELRELGVEIAPGRPTGATALTPTERRVAGLAASGATELEIAQETFMTPSAVETHLAGAKRKLGVGARAELAAALAS
jgi:DNA-binding CsgD family transcriptional regulator